MVGIGRLAALATCTVGAVYAQHHSHEGQGTYIPQLAGISGRIATIQSDINILVTAYSASLQPNVAPSEDATRELIQGLHEQIDKALPLATQVFHTTAHGITQISTVSPFLAAVGRSAELVTSTWTGFPVDRKMIQPVVMLRTDLFRLGEFMKRNDNDAFGKTLTDLSEKVGVMQDQAMDKEKENDIQKRGFSISDVKNSLGKTEKIFGDMTNQLKFDDQLQGACIGCLMDVCSELMCYVASLCGAANNGFTKLLSARNGLDITSVFKPSINAVVNTVDTFANKLKQQVQLDSTVVPTVNLLATSVSNLADVTDRFKMTDASAKLHVQAQELTQWAGKLAKKPISKPGGKRSSPKPRV